MAAGWELASPSLHKTVFSPVFPFPLTAFLRDPFVFSSLPGKKKKNSYPCEKELVPFLAAPNPSNMLQTQG